MSLGRTIGVLLGAFFFALLLWSYVRLSSPYEAELDLPLKVVSPRGLAPVTGLPEHIHTRVRGVGWQVLLMAFTHNSRFDLDLAERAISDLRNPRLTIHSDELLHNVVIPSEVQLLKADPDSLDLSFGPLVRKTIPIDPRLDISAAPGFTLVGMPSVRPDRLLIEGSSAVLDSLRSFPTKTFREHNLRSDFDQTMELLDTLTNSTILHAPKEIIVHWSVQAVGERTFENIPIQLDAVPPNREVILNPTVATIVIRGGADKLAHLTAQQLHAHISYKPALFDTAETVKPEVESAPGTTVLSVDPAEVRFVVRKLDSGTP